MNFKNGFFLCPGPLDLFLEMGLWKHFCPWSFCRFFLSSCTLTPKTITGFGVRGRGTKEARGPSSSPPCAVDREPGGRRVSRQRRVGAAAHRLLGAEGQNLEALGGLPAEVLTPRKVSIGSLSCQQGAPAPGVPSAAVRLSSQDRLQREQTAVVAGVVVAGVSGTERFPGISISERWAPALSAQAGLLSGHVGLSPFLGIHRGTASLPRGSQGACSTDFRGREG